MSNSSSSPYDLASSNSEDEQQTEWKQVTPKKSQSSGKSEVLQNKFVLLSNDSLSGNENSPSYRSNSPSFHASSSKSSLGSFNRFNALMAGNSLQNSTRNGVSTSFSKERQGSSNSSVSSLPDLSHSGSQAALQKQITQRLQEMRKANSKPKTQKNQQKSPWLSHPANVSKFQSFLHSFDWSIHEPKLENLWLSVLGNPQKFIFILLDYLEEIFLDQFPSVQVEAETFMDDLPSSFLFDSSLAEDDRCYHLIDAFRVGVEGRLESFLRSKLESPEFKIEDIFTNLLEIVLKNQKFRNGSNSFASALVLSKLTKIFPFQALLAIREMVLAGGEGGAPSLSLQGQGYFYLWMLWMIFEEEPSQSNSLSDLLLDEISTKWSFISNNLLLCSLQCIEDFGKETCQSHSRNCSFLSQAGQKIINILLGLQPNEGTGSHSSRNYQTISRCLVGIFCKIYALEFVVCLNGGNCCLIPLIPSTFQACAKFPEHQDEFFIFLSSCISGGIHSNSNSSSQSSSSRAKQIFQALTTTNNGVYEKYLGTVSRNFLTFLLSKTDEEEAAKYYEFSTLFLQHTRSMLMHGRRWAGSVADQNGFTRNDAFQNAELLEKLSMRGRKATKTRRLSLSFILLLLTLSILLVPLALKTISLLNTPSSNYHSLPILSQLSENENVKKAKRLITTHLLPKCKSLYQSTFSKEGPLLPLLTHTFLRGREGTTRALQKYRPILHSLATRYRQHGESLVRYYWNEETVAIYRQKTTNLAKRARSYLRDAAIALAERRKRRTKDKKNDQPID